MGGTGEVCQDGEKDIKDQAAGQKKDEPVEKDKKGERQSAHKRALKEAKAVEEDEEDTEEEDSDDFEEEGEEESPNVPDPEVKHPKIMVPVCDSDAEDGDLFRRGYHSSGEGKKKKHDPRKDSFASSDRRQLDKIEPHLLEILPASLSRTYLGYKV